MNLTKKVIGVKYEGSAYAAQLGVEIPLIECVLYTRPMTDLHDSVYLIPLMTLISSKPL